MIQEKSTTSKDWKWAREDVIIASLDMFIFIFTLKTQQV